jgi:hypothetical protein
MDLFPTFAKIAGGKVPDDRIIDGVCLVPALNPIMLPVKKTGVLSGKPV